MTSIETKSQALDLTDDFPVQVPPRMVLEIAYGLEAPIDIAQRYGFNEVQFGVLCQHDPFRKAVDAKRAELKAGGYSFRMKAALAAEDLLQEVAVLAISKHTDFGEKMDALKFLTKVGDLEPKESKTVAQGSGFSITINLDSPGMPPQRRVEGEVIDVPIKSTFKDPLGEFEDGAPPLVKEAQADLSAETKPFDVPQMTMDGQPSPGSKLVEMFQMSNADLSAGIA